MKNNKITFSRLSPSKKGLVAHSYVRTTNIDIDGRHKEMAKGFNSLSTHEQNVAISGVEVG